MTFQEALITGEVALNAEIFEASHTYHVKGVDKYLTVVEQKGRRYFKAYVAETLDGDWKPLAATESKPFASWRNVQPAAGVMPWTDNISHGELIRDGVDQTLQVDPANWRFLFQGMLEKDKAQKWLWGFGWRLGLLRPVGANAE